MREIKFRAWHKKRKELYEVYSFNKEFVFKKTLDGLGCDGNPDKREDCILKQYIGNTEIHSVNIHKYNDDNLYIREYNFPEGHREYEKND